jgi:dihydrolipoamide dehydrogenase
MSEAYDMVIIGAGPGGYTAALRGRQLGLTVALVEKERTGGVCLNRGCIPTKALLADAEGLIWAGRAAKEGIIDRTPVPDFSRMQRRKADVVGKTVSNLEKLLTNNGVTLFHDTATVPEPGLVKTSSGNTIKAGNIVIASGSRPWNPPIPGVDLPGVVSTRQILELERVPRELVIIGAGVIGQEFAAIFSALGSKVTVLEVLDRILNEVDSEIARRYASVLPGRQVTTQVGVRVHAIEHDGTGLRVIYEKKAKEKIASCDLVLLATGRKPNLDSIGRWRSGHSGERHGALEVDALLRTSVDGSLCHRGRNG